MCTYFVEGWKAFMNKAGKKVVLITGGTSGIGLAAAALFLQDGWQVAVMGRDAGRGQDALDYLKKNAGNRVLLRAFYPLV